MKDATEQGQPYRLILLGLPRPGMDGYTATEATMSRPQLVDARVVVLTSPPLYACLLHAAVSLGRGEPFRSSSAKACTF